MISKQLQSYIKSYRDDNELGDLKDGAVFCRFATETILNRFARQEPGVLRGAIESICVDGFDDTGIDAICIIINGEIVASLENAKEMMERFAGNKEINVEFWFFQHEYKDEFKLEKFTSFKDGVMNFLDVDSSFETNQEIQDAILIRDYLFSDEVTTLAEWGSEPKVKLFYASVGQWQEPPHIVQSAEKFKADVQNIKSTLYKDVSVTFVDTSSLIAYHNESRNKFKGKLVLRGGSISIITESFAETDNLLQNAFIATCTGDSLINFLKDEDGKLRESIFEDNVRAYQGGTATNESIYETVTKTPDLFGLYNNGITIVCEKIGSPKGHAYFLTNPQIVNGCQTSTSLFRAYENNHDISNVLVFVKIIATEDVELISQIVYGTNTQNIVPRETFATTKPFHKNLEEYIFALNGHQKESVNKVFYERRSKQYLLEVGIKNTQKINFMQLVKAFVAMFFNDPHNAYKHEGVLIKDPIYTNRIFQDAQPLHPYYTASLCYVKISRQFKSPSLVNTDVKTWRTYPGQIMFLVKTLAAEKTMQPDINNKNEIESYCNIILKNITNQELFEKCFSDAIRIFKQAYDGWKNKYHIKDNEQFTKHLMEILKVKPPSLPKPIGLTAEVHKSLKSLGQQEKKEEDWYDGSSLGKVLLLKQDRRGGWYAFISRMPNNIFAHEDANPGINFTKDLKVGDTVSYVEDHQIINAASGQLKRMQAVKVQKLSS